MNAPAYVVDEFRKRCRTDPGAILFIDLPVVGGRTVWTCSMCGKEEIWNERWRTYGSIMLEECGVTVPVCSDACKASYETMRKGP